MEKFESFKLKPGELEKASEPLNDIELDEMLIELKSKTVNKKSIGLGKSPFESISEVNEEYEQTILVD